MLLRWILHLLGVDDLPDPAWRSTGYQARFTGHDEAGAVAAVKQRDELEAARRKIAARRSVPRLATGGEPPCADRNPTPGIRRPR